MEKCGRDLWKNAQFVANRSSFSKNTDHSAQTIYQETPNDPKHLFKLRIFCRLSNGHGCFRSL